jgi:hypothetical protein
MMFFTIVFTQSDKRGDSGGLIPSSLTEEKLKIRKKVKNMNNKMLISQKSDRQRSIGRCTEARRN